MKYSSPRLVFASIVAVAFELTVAERVSFLGGRPELLLTLACFAALFASRPGQGWAVAWILGLAKDCGSALPLGFHAFLFTALAWGLVHLQRYVFREHPLTQAAIVLGAALAIDLIAALFTCLVAGGIPFWILVFKAFAGAILSAVLAPVVFWGLRSWKAYLRPA